MSELHNGGAAGCSLPRYSLLYFVKGIAVLPLFSGQHSISLLPEVFAWTGARR